jgi:hypothetical protein
MLLGALCAVGALLFAWFAVSRVPHDVRLPLNVFLIFYVLTTAIGATLLSVPVIRELWTLTFPNLDASWLDPAQSWGYWFMVWGPLIVTPLASTWFYARVRAPVVFASRLLERRIDVLSASLVATLMCGYCLVNLGTKGYLGASPLSHELLGSYQLNILMRAEMFNTLGTIHFACIYVGIPAVAMVALCNAARRRGQVWWVLFAALSAVLTILYVGTFIKSNILIYGVAVVIAAQVLGIIRLRGLAVSAILGILVLSLLTALLSGSNPLDVAITGYNVLFRVASNVPFYLAIFPQQVPFVGIDVALGGFGIGPTEPVVQTVSNFMMPHETWVQGAAPAAAHVMGYAQGGYPWAFVTMILVGLWIAISAHLRRVAHNPLVFSAFIGAVTTCYYLSQGDFVGAFLASYGYRWWLAALLLVIVVQRALELALGTATPAPGEALSEET